MPAPIPPPDNKKTLKVFGPWRGIREVDAEDGDFEALWNVEVRDRCLCTRGGRRAIFSGTHYVLPVAAFKFKHTVIDPEFLGWQQGERYDVTQAASGDGGTITLDTLGGDVGDALWLGFNAPIEELVFDLAAAGNAVPATLSMEYFGANGWANLPVIEDGTASMVPDPPNPDPVPATFGLETEGCAVTFSAPEDWKASGIPMQSQGVPPAMRSKKLYWLKLTFSAELDGGVITAIRGQVEVQTGDLYGANGAFHWKTPGGERHLVVGLDDRQNGHARLFSYDRVRQTLRGFDIPADAAKSGPDAWWSFVALPEGLVACNGYCLLFATSDDPLRMQPFGPVLLEADNSQTNAPPSAADFVTTFGDRLIAAKGNTVWVSCPYGDVAGIDARAYAPLRGCSVFYDFAFFTVMDDFGGKITGMCTLGNVLLVFTPRSTWRVTSIDTWNGPSSCRRIDANTGCVAPRTLKAASVELAFFLGSDGVYATDGSAPKLVSGAIERTVRGLNASAISGAVGEVYRAKRQYRLWVPSSHDFKNDLGLVFDFERRLWTKFGLPPTLRGIDAGARPWNRFEVACLLSAQDDEWPEELLSIDYEGRLFQEDVGRTDDPSAAPIPTILVLAATKAQDQHYCTVNGLRASVMTDGEAPVQVGVLVNNSPVDQVDLAPDVGTEAFDPTDASAGGSFSLLDARSTAAQQCFDSGGEVGDGVRLGTDAWTQKRVLSRTVGLGVNARSFKVVLTSGVMLAAVGESALGVPGALELEGFEVEVTSLSAKRGDD